MTTPDTAPAGSAPAPPSSPREVVLVAIVAANGVLGDGADQPWHLREDQRRFMRMTKGHPLIMGRRTWDALGAACLPHRESVVLTRDTGAAAAIRAAGAHPVADLAHALAVAATLPGGEAVMVIGGGDIYRQALPEATRLELTEVDADAGGAVRFPDLDPAEWAEADRDDRWAFAFVTYRRRTGTGPPGSRP